MPERNHLPETLEGWLAIATAGLCAEAREHVRVEIGSHFDDALEAMRETGRPEAEARREALRELGSPHVAARRFRKAYLRDRERTRIKRWRQFHERPLWKKLCGPLFEFSFIVLFFYLLSFIKDKSLPFWFCLVGLIQIYIFWEKTSDFLMSSLLSTSRARHPRRRLLISAAAHLALWAWVLVLIIMIDSPVHDWLPWSWQSGTFLTAFAVFLAIIHDTIRFSGILRKMKNLPAPQSSFIGPDQHA